MPRGHDVTTCGVSLGRDRCRCLPVTSGRPNFGDGLAIGDDMGGAAGVVGDGDPIEVDAEMAVEGCEEVLGTDPAFDDFSPRRSVAPMTWPVLIRRPPRSWSWPAASGRGRAARSRGCACDASTAARHVRDPRSAAELARDDDEHSLVETPVVNVLDQRRHRLVEVRSAKGQGFEDVVVDRMVVPVGDASAEGSVEGRGDDLHARFDQSARLSGIAGPTGAGRNDRGCRIFKVQVERAPASGLVSRPSAWASNSSIARVAPVR